MIYILLTTNICRCLKRLLWSIKYIIKNNYYFNLSPENIQKKIDTLLEELQEKIGVSDKELDEFKKILGLADFSNDQK